VIKFGLRRGEREVGKVTDGHKEGEKTPDRGPRENRFFPIFKSKRSERKKVHKMPKVTIQICEEGKRHILKVFQQKKGGHWAGLLERHSGRT